MVRDALHMPKRPIPSNRVAFAYHVVISNLFQMIIHNGKSILVHGLISIFLVGLAFFVRNGLANNLLFVQVLANGFKVALFEILNDMTTSQDGLEVSKEILDENLGRLGVSQVHSFGIHGRKECCSIGVGNKARKRGMRRKHT